MDPSLLGRIWIHNPQTLLLWRQNGLDTACSVSLAVHAARHGPVHEGILDDAGGAAVADGAAAGAAGAGAGDVVDDFAVFVTGAFLGEDEAGGAGDGEDDGGDASDDDADDGGCGDGALLDGVIVVVVEGVVGG